LSKKSLEYVFRHYKEEFFDEVSFHFFCNNILIHCPDIINEDEVN